MLIKYDREADAKYIRLSKHKVKRTEAKEPWLLFDFDSRDRVVGVEILEASKNPIGIGTKNDGGVEVAAVSESVSPAYVYQDAIQEFSSFLSCSSTATPSYV